MSDCSRTEMMTVAAARLLWDGCGYNRLRIWNYGLDPIALQQTMTQLSSYFSEDDRMPGALSTELPEPDGAPLRVRLLGENLIVWRNTSGAVDVGLVCVAHRPASRSEQLIDPLAGFMFGLWYQDAPQIPYFCILTCTPRRGAAAPRIATYKERL